MINNTNGKIMIEAKEDKRLEVAIELAKTVNNLSEMLKTMEVSVSNIHINGCHIQTAQGETALYMGNTKNSSVTNSVFQTDVVEKENGRNLRYDENEDDEEFEEDEAYAEGVSTFDKPMDSDTDINTKEIRNYAFSQTDLMKLTAQDNEIINKLCDVIDQLKEQK